MERLERFYRIDQLLKSRGTTPFALLQEELDVSRATLKRDLEYMRSRFNAPIEYDREAGGYRFGSPRTGPRYELPGLWFSSEEAYALLAMQQLLAGLEPGLLGPHVQPLMERLRAVTPAQVQSVARRYFGDGQLNTGVLVPESPRRGGSTP